MRCNKIFHLERFFENLSVLLFTKTHRSKLVLPIYDRVVVQRETLHVPTPLSFLPRLHDRVGPLGPTCFTAAWANSNLHHLLVTLLRRIEVSDEATVDRELSQIVLGCHVAAPVPTLVADTKHGNLVRGGMTVGSTFLLKCGREWRR